jgi:NADPH-dependent 7-cyano-7-deazaguanine reductase QueF
MSDALVQVDATGVTMTVTAPMVHRCPFKHEVDTGHVSLTWLVDGATLELHTLRVLLDSWREVAISHESLTVALVDELRHLGVDVVQVVTRWDTAGMAVTCST